MLLPFVRCSQLVFVSAYLFTGSGWPSCSAQSLVVVCSLVYSNTNSGLGHKSYQLYRDTSAASFSSHLKGHHSFSPSKCLHRIRDLNYCDTEVTLKPGFEVNVTYS